MLVCTCRGQSIKVFSQLLRKAVISLLWSNM
jgi:hypothetical protein